MKKHDTNTKNETKAEKTPCDCQKKIQTMETQLEEMKNKYLRALADYQNLERRVAEQFTENQKTALKSILIKLLDIVDQMERADIFVKHDGLKLILANMHKLLQSEGVRKIEILGKPYDPQIAECTEIIEGERNNEVVAVSRPAYFLHDSLLRPAQVTVSRKKYS